MNEKGSSIIANEFQNAIEETFEKHHGIYTDKGTSILETITQIDYINASKLRINETIAGHVFHLNFYIQVLIEYITGKRTGKTDWNDSWKIREVNEKEWEKLIEDTRTKYKELLEFNNSINDWGKEDNIGGMIGIIAHCAYHLGAIRQLKDL